MQDIGLLWGLCQPHTACTSICLVPFSAKCEKSHYQFFFFFFYLTLELETGKLSAHAFPEILPLMPLERDQPLSISVA